MNSRLLANIAIKVVAIYLMAQGIVQVPSIVTALQYESLQIESNDGMLPIYFTSILSPLFFGLILWFISGFLSKVVGKGIDHTEESELTTNNIQVVAIATVGFILVVMSIPQLISISIQLFGNMDLVNGRKVLNINVLSYLLASITKIILGLALVLGASGWARLLNKIRGIGVK